VASQELHGVTLLGCDAVQCGRYSNLVETYSPLSSSLKVEAVHSSVKLVTVYQTKRQSGRAQFENLQVILSQVLPI
jgi:hypothetical protein